jgi:hypothetical protein
MKLDYFILAHVYIGILSEKQHERLFKNIMRAKDTFISGTMPFGTHIYYTFEDMFEHSDYEELKNLDEHDKILYPMMIVFMSRSILKQEGAGHGTSDCRA